MKHWIAALIMAGIGGGPALAEGDLSLKPMKLDDLVIGTDQSGYGVSKKDYDLVTGKSYQILIKSTGAKECAWVAPELAANIWLRKVEAGGVEIKAAVLNELEFEEAGEAEVFFVPIRPGSFAWRCRGLESRGVQGKFMVK